MNPRILLVLSAGLGLGIAFASTQAADDDLARLQGTWSLVSMERDGKAVPADRLKGRVLRIEGKTFTDRLGDKLYGEGTLTLVGAGQPRGVDATFTAGPPKGETSRGIYELDGETLRACAAEPGEKRPEAFTTAPGSGRMLVVFRRAKP